MAKIKRDDEVVVIAGKDKGKRGKVLNVAEGRVLVAGVNLVKKHVKPNPNRGEQGYKILEAGKKVRIFKSTGEVADTK